MSSKFLDTDSAVSHNHAGMNAYSGARMPEPGQSPQRPPKNIVLRGKKSVVSVGPEKHADKAGRSVRRE